jgi:hypothetical protein
LSFIVIVSAVTVVAPMNKPKTVAISGLETFRIPLVICDLPSGPDPKETRSVLKALACSSDTDTDTDTDDVSWPASNIV